VVGFDGDSHNNGYLCHKGRFGYRYMLDEQRLLKPLVKKKGVLQESSWEDALETAAKKIKAIVKKHGPEAVAVFGSPRLSNEELYLLQKWTRIGFRSNQIGSFNNLINGKNLDALDGMFGFTTSTTTMDEMKNADVIMIVNADLAEDNLVAELKIKAAMKRGARLITVNSSENELTKIADLWLDPKRGTNTALIAGLAQGLIESGRINTDYIARHTENYPEYKDSISKFTLERTAAITGVPIQKLQHGLGMLGPDMNLVIVYGLDQCLEKSKDDVKALGDLTLQLGRVGQPGNGLILVRDYVNGQGLLDMGADPRYLPGYVTPGQKNIGRFNKLWDTDLKEIFKPVDIEKKLRDRKIKALLIFGENPLISTPAQVLLKNMGFILLLDHFKTETAEAADVVLPASTPLESTGTYTACDRRVQKSDAIFPPKSGFSNLEIIGALAEKLAMPLQVKTAADILGEIRQANPFYRDVNTNDFWGKDLFREGFHTPSGKGVFLPLHIAPSPCNEEKQTIVASETYIQLNIKGKMVL
jgi:predicted molibdopterin-dependent oxidoreductase YjgC